jgi:hypothetical protein
VLDFDLTYARSYEVEEVRDFPGAGPLGHPLIYIPTPGNRPEHDGLWLRFSPKGGEPWVGIFKFGYSSPPAFSRVVSSPDVDRVWIVANGAGFLVTPGDRAKWEQIALLPILDIRPVQQHGLVILSNFTKLAAYGEQGLVWVSPRVCWDELKIVSVTDDTIEGIGYDPINLTQARFAVDIRTGRLLLPAPVSTEGTPLW